MALLAVPLPDLGKLVGLAEPLAMCRPAAELTSLCLQHLHGGPGPVLWLGCGDEEVHQPGGEPEHDTVGAEHLGLPGTCHHPDPGTRLGCVPLP